MRSFARASVLAILAMLLFVTGMAFAYGHGSHGSSVDVVIGAAVWGPWYYPGPYYYPNYYPYYEPYYPYYYSPEVAEPPTYIEPDQPMQQSTPSGVWYYCPGSSTYYPYVTECPGGWQAVPAQPSSEQER